MFDSYHRYPKERVHQFLKYLAYAASKEYKRKKREPILRQVYEEDSLDMPVFTKRQLIESGDYKRKVQERINKLDDSRRQELETKIAVHYTKNKFLPYEKKLKALKSRCSRMRPKTKTGKKKVKKIRKKLDNCSELLKNLKKNYLDVASH